MRSALAAAFSTTVLLAAVTASAQLKKNADDGILARLSYGNTMMEYSGAAQPRRVCFAVYDSGLYRLWRPDATNLGPHDPDPAHVIFQGSLTTEQMRQLGAMLKNLNLNSQGDGFIQQGAESFLAELVDAGRDERFNWVNPDHRRPFPPAITRIVAWMRDFRPHNAAKVTLRDLSDISVCPSANENPLPLRANAP